MKPRTFRGDGVELKDGSLEPLLPHTDNELRAKIVNIDRSFSIGKDEYEEFLLPNYYLDRLVEFIKDYALQAQKELAIRAWQAHESKVPYAGSMMFDTLRYWIWDESKNKFISELKAPHKNERNKK